ncbi:hypothetical protein ACOZ4N_20430 (plasmid) [Halorientalis pallida]|uniref:hypothetical protein n=1 Tax=Halorientalis pallida TaxID=2479928 RepID=UPI003C6F6CCE
MDSSRDGDDEQTTDISDTDTHNTHSLDRRSVLKLTGAAAAVGGGLVGTSGGVAGQTPREDEVTTDDFEFDRVLDAVDDLGADPNGNRDVVPLIRDAYQSGTKIEFPPGTYKLGSTWFDYDSAVSQFGIVGTGDSQRDVEFLVPDGRFNDGYAFGLRGPKTHHLFRNFSIQQGPDGERLFAMLLYFEDGLLFEDVEWLGVTPDSTTVGDAATVQNGIGITTTEGVGTLRRCQIGVDAPGLQNGYPTGLGWMFMGPFNGSSHRGEIQMVDCRAERQGANPMRTDGSPGVITIRGGLYRNNDNVNVRLAGGDHPTKHSVVDGATVVVDEDHGDNSANAILVDNALIEMSGLVVRNTDVIYTDTTVAADQPVIDVPSWGNHGSVTFENCRVRNENPGALTLNADAVAQTGDLEITVDGCDFTGSGRGIDIDGRPGSVVRNSCFDMPNGEITGTVSVENTAESGCERPDSDGQSDTSPEPSASVSTGSASAVDDDSATLSGSLDDLVEVSSVDVSIKTREAGADDWQELGTERRSAPGEFSFDASGLSAETEYEFCAAVVDDAVAATGSTKSFTTALPADTRTLVFRGTGSASNYRATVSGDLFADPESDDLESWDSIDGSTASGWVSDDTTVDTYLFTGEVTDLSPDGAAVYVDGERVDSDGSADRRTLTVEGTGTASNYSVTVSGELSAHPEHDDLEAWDSIDGSTASGWVTDDTNVDTFQFTGEVTDLSPDGAAIYVDGERIDSGGSSEPRQHTLTVEGTGSPSNYSVTVSGELSAHPEYDDLEAWDSIDGSTASGWVTDDTNVDTFQFTGEVTDLSSDGAAVYVDGDRLDPDTV